MQISRRWLIGSFCLHLLVTACGGGGEASSTAASASSQASNSSQAASSSSASSVAVKVSWSAPAAITYGTALSAIQLNATANSAGSFTYSPAIGTLLDAGTHTLLTTFTPTDSSKPSLQSSVSITVKKADPVVVWDTPLQAAAGSWLNGAGLSAKASVAGTFSYTPASGSYLGTAGTVKLSASFTPSDTNNYNSVSASQTLTVGKGNPALTWKEPAPIVAGTALTATQLNATARYGTAGTFTYLPALGSVMNTVGTTTLKVTFTPKDSTNFNTATASTVLTVLPVTTTAQVDFGAKAQMIRGFGGSAAWYYSKMSAARLNALFGDDGLGLSIMRLRIAPAAWNSDTQSAATSEWTAELVNGKAAQDLGATIFASPWSPPASMKTNNDSRTNKLWSGNLATASYADYAKYLKAYINYAAQKGVNLYAISLQNEPDWDPQDYESCLWIAEQIRAWTVNHGATAISGTSVKLMLPESFYASIPMTDTVLGDASASANVGIVGGHLYGGAPLYPELAKAQGKEVWMTEHFLDSTAKSSSATSWKTNLADAIAAAKEVHDTMTLGQYNAFVWWWLVNSNDSTPTGLIDTSNQPTYFGLALKHFARYVRPGYQRVAATSQPVSGVYLSAYAGSGRQVLVLINSNNSAVSLPVQIKNQTVTSLTPYQTTASSSFAQLSAIAVSNGNLTINLPAQSITTLVQ